MYPFSEIEREIICSYRGLQDCSGIKVLATKPHVVSLISLDLHAGGENLLFCNLSFNMDACHGTCAGAHADTYVYSGIHVNTRQNFILKCSYHEGEFQNPGIIQHLDRKCL